jgi:hypothetical protein
MRSILGMTAAVLVLSVANASGFAAEKQSAVKVFDACMALAKSRGYDAKDRQIGEADSPVHKLCAPAWRESRA